MEPMITPRDPHDPSVVSAMSSELAQLPTSSFTSIASIVADAVGAETCRILVADYALRILRPLSVEDVNAEEIQVEGTMAGRCFASGEVLVHSDAASIIWVPLTEGVDRIGVMELVFGVDAVLPTYIDAIAGLVVVAIVSRRRYTDAVHLARRSQKLTEAAESQWDLLPPLSHEAGGVSVSGAVEPAYNIGGDSFDYAFNRHVLQFAVLDAVGHGLESVLMSAAAVHSLRNARRSHLSLAQSYAQADTRIALQFGHSNYVTGQLATLDLTSGKLTWLNAGHVLPLHIRDRSFIGELTCAPSRPMGLRGRVVEVAVVQLQPGDRVLFYTDGVIESRSPDGSLFGSDMLADFLVRATIDGVPVAETVRRLTANVVNHVGGELRDDATMFLVEYGQVTQD